MPTIYPDGSTDSGGITMDLINRVPANQLGMYSDPRTMEMYAATAGSAALQASAQQANETNIQLAEDNRKFNAEQAKLNRDWQEKMSNTAHQREMADLLAAGLNPILTATGGHGASTPTGSSAQSQSATVEADLKANPYQSLSQSVVSARELGISEKRLAMDTRRFLDLDMKMATEQALTMEAQRRLASAQALQAEGQAALTPYHMKSLLSQAGMYGAQANAANQSASLTPYQKQLLEAQEYSARAQGDKASGSQESLLKNYGIPLIQSVKDALPGAVSGIGKAAGQIADYYAPGAFLKRGLSSIGKHLDTDEFYHKEEYYRNKRKK